METPTEGPKSNLKFKCLFVLFGVVSLLAWNAILTKIEFFNYYVKNLQPYNSFSFLNFTLNIVLQFVFLWKKDLLKLKNQLYIGLIGSIILLIVTPVVSYNLYSSHDSANFFFTALLILIMGLINALLSSGFFTLVSHFPLEDIVALSVGQGFSGIIMNIIQYIILATIEKEKRIVDAIIFFSISSFILLVSFICLIFSFKTEYFKYYLEKEDIFIDKVGKLTEGENEGNEENENDNVENLMGDLAGKRKLTFIQIFKILKDIDLLCSFIYIITFAVFPVAFSKHILFSLNEAYSINTLLILYNFFDTFGRFLVSSITPTKMLTYITIISRAALLITFFLNSLFIGNKFSIYLTSILDIFNISLLAITNGIGTTLCFGIAPTLVMDEYKGQAGSTVSFFTILGIFLGSCLQFGTKEIKKILENRN